MTSQAVRADVVFSSKHWIGHLYDAWLIYTIGLADTARVAGFIRNLYPDFAADGLFTDTPHILQGAIEGVNPAHVGWVREDLPGMPH